MSTKPEIDVNVINVRAPNGTNQLLTINTSEELLFTGVMPPQTIGLVVTKLLHATRDHSLKEEPAESSFSQPLTTTSACR